MRTALVARRLGSENTSAGFGKSLVWLAPGCRWPRPHSSRPPAPGPAPEPEPPAPSAASESVPWGEANVVVWLAADSQPDPGNNVSTWARLNRSLDDVASLPVRPDYVVLAGDVVDANDVGRRSGDAAARANIRRTRAAYARLPWFRTAPSNGGLVVSGNHEWHYPRVFARDFGSECTGAPALVRMDTRVNLRFYGVCSVRGRPVWYGPSLPALREEFERLDRRGVPMNVVTVAHQPVPGTVSDCHTATADIRWMAPDEARRFRNLARDYGDDHYALSLAGHTHGQWSDVGRHHVERAGVSFVDLPVFGAANRYSDGGWCDGTGFGTGDSVFMTLQYGSDRARLWARHGCDDPDADGACDRQPYWSDPVVVDLGYPIWPWPEPGKSGRVNITGAGDGG